MYDYIYEWNNLKENSPEEDVRNYWLYTYGAFGCLNGLWFPCKVALKNTLGAPYSVVAVPIGNEDLSIYPKGEILVRDMDVFYSTFATGAPIYVYIVHALKRKQLTDRMLSGALRRSLNTELLYAPRKMLQKVKRAANRGDKEEIFVLDGVNKDEIGAIALPRTIEIVEKLWNSNDWAVQEISQLLGISYNPAHGKKERMLQNELLGDRDLTLMNRRKLTMRLIRAAEKFGESVRHISTSIDVIDRGLSYERDEVTDSELDTGRTNDPIGSTDKGE